MHEHLERMEHLKAELRDLRPAPGELLPPDLQRARDIELTYTSNAIEGNTLTLDETADLIEHGITAGGKQMREHLEAIDHHEAVQWMRTLAAGDSPLGEGTVAELHRRVVLNSRKDIAGVYSRNARRIYGSDVVFPNPVKIPALMERLGLELSRIDNSPRSAFDMHHRLVTIHPFDDGNGRTARLLMNLILLRGGYVPIPIGPRDRRDYLDAIRTAQLAQDEHAPAFQALMHGRLADTLQDYVDDLRQGRDARAAALRGP